MKISMIIMAVILASSVANAASSKMIGSFKIVDHCSPSVEKNAKTIYLIKQWHLAPSTSTVDVEKSKKLPQYQNQLEIYQSLVDQIQSKKIDTLVAEGCEGEINSKFSETFNGWNFEKLSKETSKKEYASILTHPLLKLEVKYPATHTLCGDQLSEVKNAQLALSDLRADVGYWQRLVELEKTPEKQKLYLDGVIEMFKLPSNTDTTNAVLALKKDVLESFQKFTAANDKRNTILVEVLKKVDSAKPIAVVFGGLHTHDLKVKFEAERWNCEILEPKSYQNQEETLMNEFKKLTK